MHRAVDGWSKMAAPDVGGMSDRNMPAGTETSFRRKARGKLPALRGTRPSVHNGQLLVSTGVPSLDHILGGGLAVGTLLLIAQWVSWNYMTATTGVGVLVYYPDIIQAWSIVHQNQKEENQDPKLLKPRNGACSCAGAQTYMQEEK